jgi:hypothetical protein
MESRRRPVRDPKSVARGATVRSERVGSSLGWGTHALGLADVEAAFAALVDGRATGKLGLTRPRFRRRPTGIQWEARGRGSFEQVPQLR